jgi:Predicted nucleotide-binding protein containing TIR-like domain
VANILFEYGYLAARMTRNRVAICRSAGAHIPTDLSNIKFIEFGSSDPGLPEIPVRAAADITAWVRGLPRLASGMQAVVQFHGYSGYWRVRNRFTLWHDYVPKSGEKIYFDGRAIILLPINGKGGTGSILGYLHVSLKNYRASYEILDEILGATIDADGVLTMKVRVIRRHCHESEGSAPDSRFTEDLPNRDFELSLEPVPGHAGLLQGKHTYEQGIEPYSRAEERYEHIDHYRQ